MLLWLTLAHAASFPVDPAARVDLTVICNDVVVRPSPDALVHVDGPVEAHTSARSLMLTAPPMDCTQVTVQVPGGLDLGITTVSGAVTAEADARRLSVNTVSGEITVQGRLPRLDVSTVSGDVVLRASEVDEGSVSTVSSDVRWEASLTPTARVSINTHSGDVHVAPPGPEPRLDVSSFGKPGWTSGPADGPSVVVSTFSGSVGPKR